MREHLLERRHQVDSRISSTHPCLRHYNQRVIANTLLLSLIVLVAGSCSHIGSNAIAGDAAAIRGTRVPQLMLKFH
jgi:hypothetical protein